MARITVEDCLKCVDNMYELIHITTRRVRQLRRGSEPTVKSKNRIIVTALREIAAGKVRRSVESKGNSEDLDIMPN